MTPKTTPIKKEEEVQQNPDHRINEDFTGFPHLPADKKSITPLSKIDKKLAGSNKKSSNKTYGS